MAAEERPWPPPFILGCWQLSAGHHGPLDEAETGSALEAQLRHGACAFDCGDIYAGVEERLGRFLASARAAGVPGAASARMHTKLVPDLDRLGDYTPEDVEAPLRRVRARVCRGSARHVGRKPCSIACGRPSLAEFDLPGRICAEFRRRRADFGRTRQQASWKAMRISKFCVGYV